MNNTEKFIDAMRLIKSTCLEHGSICYGCFYYSNEYRECMAEIVLDKYPFEWEFDEDEGKRS